MTMRTTAILSLLFLAALTATAQNAPKPTNDAWKKIEFLLGRWTGVAGEKDTTLGAGQGGFSFTAELNQKIVVRRNNATYDSGASHDDLMVIYLDSPNDTPRAIYFDTEGHVIRYNLSFPEANRVVFESDGTQPGPKYRLTYWMNGQSLDGKFELAPPGSEYKPYMSWTSKRN
jgi:hypothetical protein